MTKSVSYNDFRVRLETLASQLTALPEPVDAIVCLARGGFHVGAHLAEMLNISGRYLVGLPTYRNGDDYVIGDLAKLGDFDGLHVLVVDDATDRGILIEHTRMALLIDHGAKSVTTCALVAATLAGQPDLVERVGPIPTFHWEITQ